MRRWVLYIYERFPPIIYGSLALGLSLSGAHLNGGNASFGATFLAFVGLWGFLFAMRLSNDINDVSKDKIAFPDRPLVDGRIKVQEAQSLLFLLLLLLFAYSELLWVVLGAAAAASFLLLASFAWLAHYRLYAPSLLMKFPFLTTLLAPIYSFLLVFFSVSAGAPTRVFSVKTWGFGAVLYGSMLTYSLCRKLSPHLHPIEAAFIHFYGYRKTFYVAFFGLIVSGIGASIIQVGGLLWPVELVVLISLLIQFYQPDQYRLCSMAAAVSLVAHAWAGIF